MPNPSFEEYSQCPDVNPDISTAINWINPTMYSPDYFNECDTRVTFSLGVPQNWYGFQVAKSGVAYAGVITKYGFSSTLREYIQVKLTDSLKIGKKYLVKYYISVADSSPYSVNKVGAYLSKEQISNSSQSNLEFTPQIANNFSLDNANEWFEIKDTFVSINKETYITIGNFLNDDDTDTLNLIAFSPTHENSSYVYIDDVSVECIDCDLGFSEKTNKKTKIAFNSINQNISITLGNNPNLINSAVYITDNIGKLVFFEKINTIKTEIDTKNFPSGLYFVSISDSQSFETTKIIITNLN